MFESWFSPKDRSAKVSYPAALNSHRQKDRSLTQGYQPGSGLQMNNCISFFNYKGGTGKTTSCLSIAGRLAKLGKRVLIVDWDPQANATFSLGVDPDRIKRSMYDVVMNQLEGYSGLTLKEIVIATPIPNLDLAPAELKLSTAETAMYKNDAPPEILVDCFSSVQNYYDFILVDMPSGSNAFMTSGLRAASQLVVPCGAGTYSLQGLQNVKRFLGDLKRRTGHTVPHVTVVLTRGTEDNLLQAIGHRNAATTDDMEDDLRYMFGSVYKVPDSQDILEAQRASLPVTHFAPRCSASRAYAQITEKILKNATVPGLVPSQAPQGLGVPVVA